MRYISLAALAAACFATPAFAQDGAPADAPFNGLRVEALAGFDSLSVNAEGFDLSEYEDDATTANGISYSIAAGYDVAFGGGVVGIEAEFGDSTGEFGDDDIFSALHTGRDLYIGARFGVLATPTTLVYAKGGYTNARVTLDGEDLNLSAADIADIADFVGVPPADLAGINDFEGRVTLDGYRLGAGVEQSFGRNLFAKVEYRFSSYGAKKVKLEIDGDDEEFDLDELDGDLNLDRHQVLLGVGFRF